MESTFENIENNKQFSPERKTFGQKLGDAILGIFDLASFFLLALGIVLCIRFFIFSPFTVVGQSMEPNFHGDDFVIIDKVSSQKAKLQERYAQS
jgi:signal peptidase I